MSETSTDRAAGPPEIDEDVADALRTVVDPCSVATGAPLNLLDMGLVKRAERVGDRVEVELRLTSPICWNAAPMMEAVERAVSRVAGVRAVTCAADHGLEWMPDLITADGQERLRRLRPVPPRRH